MLALLGGTPVITDKSLHRNYPPVRRRERERIAAALDSEILWGPWAPMTRELERRWADRIGVRYCAALNSGTAALHCALVGCGIKPGDEVVVPAYSFIATASAPLMAGAIPIFVDIESDTGNINSALIESVITEQTKAIVVAHLHGLPADMDAIRTISRTYGLHIIEDCAQSAGARYMGASVGSLSDAGAFSMNATKVLAGPEGGLLTTNDEQVFNRAARMRVFGTEWRNGEERIRDADSLGFNYRTNELMAAFTLARLESFDDERESRIKNALHFLKSVKDLPGLSFPPTPEDRDHIFQMIRLRIDNQSLGYALSAEELRERIVLALTAEGANWWIWERKPLPSYAIFRSLNAEGGNFPWCASKTRKDMTYRTEDYPVSLDTARDSIFTASHFPPNGLQLMDLYIEAFRKVWANLDAVAEIPLPPPEDRIQMPF